MNLSQFNSMINSISGSSTSTTNNNISTQSNNGITTFTITNRSINIPLALDNLIIQGDNLSRRIHFEMPRYYEGEDISTKTIQIKFENANGDTGYCETSNLTWTDTSVEFDWVIDSMVSEINGDLKIQVEVSDTDTNGNLLYQLQTDIVTLTVKKTLIANNSANLGTDYYLDVLFLNEYDGLDIVHSDIASSIAMVEISDRSILMPSIENMAIYRDANSRMITFTINRYVDYVDLADMTIGIKYQLADGRGDMSFVCNKQVSNTHIQFDWLLDSKVTSQIGKVTFAIEFLGYLANGDFYCWNTLPSYIFVKEGLDINDCIEQPTASWIQTWNIIADTYLAEFERAVREGQTQLVQITKLVSETLAYHDLIKNYVALVENARDSAYYEAERSKYYHEQALNSEKITTALKNETQTLHDNIFAIASTFRKVTDPITKDDLSINLQNEIDGKADSADVRLKSVPITENDLDAALASKINSGGSGSGSGTGSGTGAIIDDTVASFNKVYSSAHTENIIDDKISTAFNSANNGLLTDAERLKLSRIEDNANFYEHPLSHPADIIVETSDKQFVSSTEKTSWDDKYTKVEIDNLISGISTGIVWKTAVSTYNDILTTYPNPEKDWCVQTNDGTYLYNGVDWIKIGSSSIPLASQSTNGLMSSSDKIKLDNLISASTYVHPTTHPADMIVEDSTRRFVTASMYNKINNWDSDLATILASYRKTTVPIVESDLDADLINKINSAGSSGSGGSSNGGTSGSVIDDTTLTPDADYTYSQVKIVELISEAVEPAEQADLDLLFI